MNPLVENVFTLRIHQVKVTGLQLRSSLLTGVSQNCFSGHGLEINSDSSREQLSLHFSALKHVLGKFNHSQGASTEDHMYVAAVASSCLLTSPQLTGDLELDLGIKFVLLEAFEEILMRLFDQ